jgi:glycosyltransferase involved in cell wall biosynthesis
MREKRPTIKVLIAGNKGHVTETEMIKGLIEKGVDVHAAFAPDSPQIAELQSANVPTKTLDLKSNVDPARAREIRHWIRDEGFNIVHGLANRQVANLIWASYGLPNKVIAYRGAIGHVSRWDPSCYLKWLNPRIDKIVCVSKAVERDLAASGVRPEKLVTIYKGHDLDWYKDLDPAQARREVNAEFGIPEDAVLVGMAANMRRVKGADLLMRALMALPDHVHGLFIGEVRDPLLHKLAAHPSIKRRVHFAGYRDGATRLIGALDINVAPSRGREGLTKSIIEGMVQGVPSVVSDAGGLPELVADETPSPVFPADDLRRLTALIQHTLEREVGNHRLKPNQSRLPSRFLLGSTVEQTHELYTELLETL